MTSKRPAASTAGDRIEVAGNCQSVATIAYRRVRAVVRFDGKPCRDDAADLFEAFGRAVFGNVVGLVPVRILEVDDVDRRDITDFV